MILYHASPTRGMKIIDPSKQKSGVDGIHKKEVYASTDKSYAAGFCFNWNSSEGFTYGKNNDRNPWELKVPPKYSQRLNVPCSIYTVDTSSFRYLNISTPEYASKYKVKIISEEKYQTSLMCLRKNGVRVSILKRRPFIDNALTREFKDLIEKKNSIDDALIKNFKIKESPIQGKGVFATQELFPGDRINIAIFKNIIYHGTRFGSHLNHSENPNAVTKDEGDRYITYCEKKINVGDEITVDYTINPELEQPDPTWS
jgi:hypothetical protein